MPVDEGPERGVVSHFVLLTGLDEMTVAAGSGSCAPG
jgi:hypothetical protein